MKATLVSDFYQKGLERKNKWIKEHRSAVCYLCFLEGSFDFKQHFSTPSNDVELFFI